MKCSSKIWKKFTPLEKLIWQDMYGAFTIGPNFPPTVSQKDIDVIAHNLACEAVWTLQIYLKDFLKNHD